MIAEDIQLYSAFLYENDCVLFKDQYEYIPVLYL